MVDIGIWDILYKKEKKEINESKKEMVVFLEGRRMIVNGRRCLVGEYLFF